MGAVRAAFFFVLIGSAGQSGPDSSAILGEAARLAWLRAWSSAEPQFLQAQKPFAARGDARHALYAEVSALRSALPLRPVPVASARLADSLEHHLVQSDDRLRLRVVVSADEVVFRQPAIKGAVPEIQFPVMTPVSRSSQPARKTEH